jgi:hypothetical protein
MYVYKYIYYCVIYLYVFMCMCIYVFYMCNNIKMIIVAILKHLKGI